MEGNPYLRGDHPPTPTATPHPGEDVPVKATSGLRNSNICPFLFWNTEYYLRGMTAWQLEALGSALGFSCSKQMSAPPCRGPQCTDSFQISPAPHPAARHPCAEVPPPRGGATPLAGPPPFPWETDIVSCVSTRDRLAISAPLPLWLQTKDDSDSSGAPRARGSNGPWRGFLENIWQSLQNFPSRPKH